MEINLPALLGTLAFVVLPHLVPDTWRGIFVLNQRASHLVAAVHQTPRRSETALGGGYTQERLCDVFSFQHSGALQMNTAVAWLCSGAGILYTE